jgi:hypothetical protein
VKNIPKPGPGEHNAFTLNYIQLVSDDERVLGHLQDNAEAVTNFVRALPAAKLTTPHAEGEWTVHQILVHVLDTERVFAYRALRIARNDITDLPGFEGESYVPYSGANARHISDVLAEYASVRAATLSLFNSFDDAAWDRVGTANNDALGVRASAYIIAGHELHHLISMKENYDS